MFDKSKEMFDKSKEMLKKYLQELEEDEHNVGLCNWVIPSDTFRNFELHHYIVDGSSLIFQIWDNGNGFTEYKSN